MSYLVLARKWRPKRFAELVGQEHVVRALSHALDSGRVHHAFLFTGTRGVGKTTIARIFAKSLNCETGVGADPCGTCPVCTAVDAGRFVDLIEIDAASNTGVDDVREVIENAQYLPTRGRYKVYLIDEVHMLSRQAFNALLKTLEEPPEHVKFLLATTDPQKLPVTVLSRCLQFNLKRLTPEQIAAQIGRILAAEDIGHDARSIDLLARGADGSLRDGLSLLDQAIAYGSGALRGEDVAQMLGSVDAAEIDGLLSSLVAGDGPALYAACEHLAGYAPDFGNLLDALAAALHRAQLRQLVPAAAQPDDSPAVHAAASMPPEQVQLWYQMAVSGRRELPFAPSPRIGFEMILLRMLAFAPDAAPAQSAGSAAGAGRAAAAAAAAALAGSTVAPSSRVGATVSPSTAALEHRIGLDSPVPTASSPVASAGPAPPVPLAPPAAVRRRIAGNEDWLETASALNLRGPAGQLAAHARFVADDGGKLSLALPESHEHLRMPGLITQLGNALADALGGAPNISFAALGEARESLHERTARQRDQRQMQAEAAFSADPVVQALIHEHGARIVPDSVRPLDH